MIILAFLVVAGSCAIMIPVMLWLFQLYDKGWTWQYAALFGSMLASTDAVAIIATMKASKFISQVKADKLQLLHDHKTQGSAVFACIKSECQLSCDLAPLSSCKKPACLSSCNFHSTLLIWLLMHMLAAWQRTYISCISVCCVS